MTQKEKTVIVKFNAFETTEGLHPYLNHINITSSLDEPS
jgi:hypothetical protein